MSRDENRRRCAWLAAGAIGIVGATTAVAVTGDDPDPQLCSVEAVMGPDGQWYGRDPDQGCQFVDSYGRVFP